ncbi:gametogenetin-like [Drosophila kikkawai]|uniref:Gametogenetin-like n=1 Tax=Drosophila kikkawai TaxID=30033 RepID=A0ABM3C7B1_DROKI|nr:nascent polypeptide-associated complex subunit alpha, muscle-specific form-like [Drosophila kikkawai]
MGPLFRKKLRNRATLYTSITTQHKRTRCTRLRQSNIASNSNRDATHRPQATASEHTPASSRIQRTAALNTRASHLAHDPEHGRIATNPDQRSRTISSPRDDAWMGLALEELLDGLQMGHRPRPSLLAPLSVAGGRRQIPSAEQLDVPPDHRFGPIRVDTTPPRPRPTEAAHTPADQGKQPLADQGPDLVPLRAATTQPPATQATQKQATGGKPSPRAAPRAVGSSTRPHTGRVSTTPAGNQGQPPREAPRAAGPSTRPHTGRVATTTTGHETPSSRAAPRAAITSARSRTGPTPTTPGTRAVQAIAPLVPSGAAAAPDPDGEVEAALRECLGDLPPDVLEEMAHGAEGLDLEDLFGECSDEDGVELPMRPVSNQSVDEPREADEIIQISDSDDAEPNFRPPSTPPPAYEDIFGPGPYATRCPITTCAASSPSQSPPTTSRGYHAAVAPRQVDGPSTSQHFDLTTDEDSADERPVVAVPSRPPLPTPGEYAAAVARRRAEDLSDELGSSSAGPVRPVNPEPRSARDRPPTPPPARRGRRRSAPWADSPSESSSEEELPRDRQGHTRWLPVPDGWSTPNGTLPVGLISRIQQRLLIASRRARRYLEEEQGQRFRVQLNRDDHVRVFLHPTRK